jgi:hypothetical protein
MKSKKINVINVVSFVLFTICLLSVNAIIAQPPSLSGLSSAISSQQSIVKTIAGSICGIVFVAGIVHIVIAFTNHSQNLKNIVMAYVGGFIAFAALWAFL